MASALPSRQDSDSGDKSIECCVPMSDVCDGQAIDYSCLAKMVKVNCTFNSCDQSGFMHPSCFEKVEESVVNFISNHQFKNSSKIASMKKFNWKDPHVRDCLWKTSLGWEISTIACRHVRCKCGNGYLGKDVFWPPSNWRKVPVKKAKSNARPKLAIGAGKVEQFHKSWSKNTSQVQNTKDTKIGSGDIPGAVFTTKEMIKMGEIVNWNEDEGVGYIQNIENPVEKLCLIRVDVIEDLGSTTGDTLLGMKVDYVTVKKGKKMIAVKVILKAGMAAKHSERKNIGVVTHWVPSQLEGVIFSAEYGELIVHRKKFIPGGFIPDILGKTVRFNNVDVNTMEVFNVQAEINLNSQREEKYCSLDEISELDLLDISNVEPVFAEFDLRSRPLLRQSLCDEHVFGNVLEYGLHDHADILYQLEPFLFPLAIHKTGHRSLINLVLFLKGSYLDEVLAFITRDFFHLAQKEYGAKVLVHVLISSTITTDQKEDISKNYVELSPQNLTEFMTGHWSAGVLTASLPFLYPSILRSLALIMPINAGPLLHHSSLHQLVHHASVSDHETLHLLANRLDTENLLLSPSHLHLVVQLLNTRNVKVTGLLLHLVSGRLSQLISTHTALISTLLRSGTELQAELLLDEMFSQSHEGGAPLVIEMAISEDIEIFELMEIVVKIARLDLLSGLLDLFKQWREQLIATDLGRRWIREISRIVNSWENTSEQ